MTELNLLRVIGGLDPEVGGPAESALNACIASQRQGIKNSFAFPAPAHAATSLEPVRQRLEDEGIAVHQFPLFPRKSRKGERWGVSPALAVWMLRHAASYDIIHVHGAWGLPSVAGAVAARRVRIPSVMTPHESMTMYDVLRQGSRLRIVAKRALKAFYVRTLSLVVFASDLEARDTFGGRRGTDAAVVHHPLRSALIAPRTPISRSTAPLLIGYLGRLHPKKNLEVLISAVAEASDDAVLRIAGTGDKAYVDSLMSMVARVGMIERTEWCGFVGGDRRWPFFDELDVFAMPSHYECFGMAGAEAMARGVATIVSHSTGIGEIIDRHGCGLIAAPTVDGFARAIESLDRDRDSLEALKVHSRSVAPLELSMDRYAESIIPHYERLVRV